MFGLEDAPSIVDARWAEIPIETAALAMVVRKSNDSPAFVGRNWLVYAGFGSRRVGGVTVVHASMSEARVVMLMTDSEVDSIRVSL